MAEITVEGVKAELQKALEVRGEDYVYPKVDGYCNYVRDGEPSCLVGVVLHALGVPVERLEKADRFPVGGKSAGALMRELDAEGWTIPHEVRWIFANVQDEQDNGVPWGIAVNCAISSEL